MIESLNNVPRKTWRRNMNGMKFGRLTVIRDHIERGARYVLVKCDCGNPREQSVQRGAISGGHTTSCGCVSLEHRIKAATTHGLSRTRTFRKWTYMKARCYSVNYHAYVNYGARGIVVCDEWKDDFPAFLRDMGEAPPGLSLDRIDVNGPYCKKNCRWTTIAEQNRNRRDNHIATFQGERLCQAEIERRTGYHRAKILARRNKGETMQEIADSLVHLVKV